jgi:uncharacterized membrane protein
MSLAFWIVFYIAGVVASFYSFLKWGHDRTPNIEDYYIRTTFIWSLFWVITTPAIIYITLRNGLGELEKKLKKF